MNVVDQHLHKHSFLFRSLNSHDANFFLLTFYAVYGGLSTSLGKMILSFALVAGFCPGWTLSLICMASAQSRKIYTIFSSRLTSFSLHRPLNRPILILCTAAFFVS
jgi:hypothetical protein